MIYSLDLTWHVEEVTTKETISRSQAANHFISELCSILECRLAELSAVFDAIRALSDNQATTLPAMPNMLSHGLILALRYCLEDLYSGGHLSIHYTLEKKKEKSKKEPSHDVDWSSSIRRVKDLALKGLQAALQIVAETPVDNYFAPVPKVDAGKDHLLQNSEKGNTHGYASDSFMLNTNIFMDLEDSSDMNGGKEDSVGRRMQYAVVGAWLLVKESCSLLAKLVEISPPPLSDHLDVKSDSAKAMILLRTDEISNIGDVILDSLSRLKHNGAIAEAQVSLQSVCESVLKFSGRSNVSLSQLPVTWLNNLIHKLNGEQQVLPYFCPTKLSRCLFYEDLRDLHLVSCPFYDLSPKIANLSYSRLP